MNLRVAILLTVSALVFAACGDEAEELVCTCADGECSATDECPVVLAWPSACFDDGASYSMSLEGGGGLSLDAASGAATSCTGITYAESATIEIGDAPGGWPEAVAATCFTRGAAAEIPVCSVAFTVSDGCTGSIESWEVSIDDAPVGTATIDADLAPCLFVAEGETRNFSARGGGLVSSGTIAGCGTAGGVLTVTLSCQ
jgi:hypothetical protein